MNATSSSLTLREATYWTPLGPGTVVVADGSLVEVRLPSVPKGMPLVPSEEPVSGSTGVRAPARQSDAAVGWVAELEAYFAGERVTWTADEVDLDALGLTAFRREVYRVLLGVPPGQTVAYGELAVMAGRPGAARAVGTAMAENPIPVVVPCHRVVRGDGSLGRYGDDDRWKPFLLHLEADR